MAFPPSGYPAVDGVTPVVAADFNDVVAALQAHIGATVSFHGVSHVVTESNLEGLAQAIVGAMFAAGSHSGVSVSYNAGAGSISLSASGGGATGPQGDVGATGPQGATGPAGAGTMGFTGATGASGVQGATGPQGESGPPGAGETGATGPQGATGSPGGATGASGATGESGATGATGPAGAGETGATGPILELIPNGSWNTGNAYVKGDVVQYATMVNGFRVSTWICIENHTSSSSDAPGVGVNFDTYWTPLSTHAPGATGATGPVGATGSPGGATGATGPMGATGPGAGATGATGPAGAGGGAGYVYDPDATPAGNIYDDWSSLMTATNAANIPATIYLKPGSTIPAGTWSMDNYTLKAIVSEDVLMGTPVYLDDGCIFDFFFLTISGAHLCSLGDPVIVANSGMTDLKYLALEDRASLEADSSPMIDVGASGLTTIVLNDGSSLNTGVYNVDGMGFLTLSSSFVNGDWITGSGTVDIEFVNNSCSVEHLSSMGPSIGSIKMPGDVSGLRDAIPLVGSVTFGGLESGVVDVDLSGASAAGRVSVTTDSPSSVTGKIVTVGASQVQMSGYANPSLTDMGYTVSLTPANSNAAGVSVWVETNFAGPSFSIYTDDTLDAGEVYSWDWQLQMSANWI